MRREPDTILRDAIAACEEIAAMLDGVTEAAFLADRKTQRATERCFEIVGEALVRPLPGNANPMLPSQTTVELPFLMPPQG